jgi:hypothetical protein
MVLPPIRPSFAESLRLATPAASEKSTRGTAIIRRRFRKIVPTGWMYVRT